MNTITSDIQFLINPGSSPGHPDWATFEAMVNHHRMFQVPGDVFSRYPDSIPADIKARLREQYNSQLRKQLLLANELQLLARSFAQEGLSYLSPKGTALALQLYGDIGLRLTRDIDLFIREEDVDRFLKVLEASGYRIIQSEASKPEKYFRRYKKNYTLVNRDKGIITELHWSLFSNRLVYPCEERLAEDPEFVRTGNTAIPTMNRENHFIYLCLHGCLHQYFRLFWLRDIHEVINRWDLDWDRIAGRAEKEGISRMIHASLILAGAVFGSPQPLSQAIHDKEADQIADRVIRVIARSSLAGWKERMARIGYFMRLRREFRYKAECVLGVGKRYFM